MERIEQKTKTQELRANLQKEIKDSMIDPNLFMERGFIDQMKQLVCMLGMVRPDDEEDGGVLSFDIKSFSQDRLGEPSVDDKGIILINRNRLKIGTAAVFSQNIDTNMLGDLTIAPEDGYSINGISLITRDDRSRNVIVGLKVDFIGDDSHPEKTLKIWLKSENGYMPPSLQIHSGLSL